MKKSLFLLIGLFLALAAPRGAYANDLPQNAPITITGNSLTLGSFIEQVEKQTQYLFVYSKSEVNINEVLPIKAGRKTVAQCLKEAFAQNGMKFVFENDYIVLTAHDQLPQLLSISGSVADADSKKPLVFASLSVEEVGISNVTNGEGAFVFKFPETAANQTLRISFLGYETQNIPLKTLMAQKNNVIYLKAVALDLPSIVVRPTDALDLVERSLARVSENYPTEPMQMTGFYREMIRKGSNYVTLSEAVVDIYKTSYRSMGSDQVGIYKGRGSIDWQRIDTVFVKFRGGINSALEIDVAKYPFLGVNTPEIKDAYDFTMESPIQIDGKVHYVVAFDQKPSIQPILFRGKIYIESKSLAISRIEFNMNIEENPNASALLIHRKPIGLAIDFQYATYLVNYKEVDGKWVFDYSRTELKFDSKWQRKLFKNSYTVTSEMAITERSNNMYKIPSESRIRSNDIVMDKVADFQDEDFWEDYNIIEPESGIEQVISRIIKQLKKRQLD